MVMIMVLKERFAFLLARRSDELTETKQKRLFFLWNIIILLGTSLLVSALSLTLAIGISDPQLFVGYFRCPLIFLLNWLPVFLLQLLLYFVFNRHWLAFLLSSSLLAAGSIGNYYKFQLRYEPFMFSDMGSISTALDVARQYSLNINSRVILMVLAVLFGTVILFFVGRGRSGRTARVVGVLLIAISIWPLWNFVYSNSTIYREKTDNSDNVIAVWSQQVYISKGFVYPFIYSISESLNTAPAGYSAKEAAEILDGFEDSTIPENKRVNIIALQVESFCDLRDYGLERVDDSAYAVFDSLREQSISGLLVPNVMGGGTINTEQSILTGSYGQIECKKDSPSHVRYFNSQGYFTTGSHPNRCDYYNRINTNRYLGFQEYLFNENYYAEMTGGKWDCDDVLIPESFRLFKEKISQGENVFSFNVSLQNHSPYEASSLMYDEILWDGAGCSSETENVVNNYLGSLRVTQELLMRELEALEQMDEPVVCLIYGDHKPYFGNAVYAEAGIIFDQTSARGLIDYYSTPYYIWANDAARELTGNQFVGQGPTVSPGFLMNVLFEQLGWQGSAYMQYLATVMEKLPVVSTNQVYLVDQQPTMSLSNEDAARLDEYKKLQYYWTNSYSKR